MHITSRLEETSRMILFFTLLIAVSTPAFAVDDPLILADEAVAANPGIEALRARTRGLGELAGVAGIWKDPIFGVEYLNAPVDSFRLDRHPMSGLQFALQQNLPEWGWSTAEKEIADRKVTASRFGTNEAELQLKSSVEVLFWTLALSNLLRNVTQDHVQRTEELLEAVSANYEVGRIGQNAVLRLSVLRDRLEDDLLDFDRAEKTLSATLTKTLSRPLGTRFKTPTKPTPIPVAGTAASWLDMAIASRPLLDQIREAVRIETKDAELARIRTRPDVNVWIKYRVRTIDNAQDDGTDFASAGISVPIPWRSRKSGLGQEAAHLQNERSARARFASVLDSIESDLETIEAVWTRAHQKATTYRDQLIPAARATLDATLSDFSVGKADFASLYESEVELLFLDKAYLTAAISTYQQRALAKAATGAASLGDAR